MNNRNLINSQVSATVNEFAMMREMQLKAAAWIMERDHIWSADLAAIEADNCQTDDDLKKMRPTRERDGGQGSRATSATQAYPSSSRSSEACRDDIDWLEAAHRESHGHPGENCPVCYAEYQTHNHNDDPWSEEELI